LFPGFAMIVLATAGIAAAFRVNQSAADAQANRRETAIFYVAAAGLFLPPRAGSIRPGRDARAGRALGTRHGGNTMTAVGADGAPGSPRGSSSSRLPSCRPQCPSSRCRCRHGSILRLRAPGPAPSRSSPSIITTRSSSGTRVTCWRRRCTGIHSSTATATTSRLISGRRRRNCRTSRIPASFDILRARRARAT
jgi:hypothetical protein